MKYAFILSLFMLTACAASGPEFSDIHLSQRGSSILVYRDGGPMGIAAARDEIEINGQVACKLHPNSFFIYPAHGMTTISSTIFASPGTSKIKLNVIGNHIYYIRMSVNVGKASAGALGGLAGELTAEAMSDTGGPFIFTAIDPEQAKSELRGLKQDCI